MNDIDYSSDVEYETEKKSTGKFKITRGMVILAGAFVVVLIIMIIIIASSGKKEKTSSTYSVTDFTNLEKRMSVEASNYVAQNKIELTAEQYKIDLSKLLLENGGSISPDKLPVVRICKGYVLASKAEEEKYEPFIKCESGNTKYITTGYVSNDNTTTTKKVSTKDKTDPVITLIGDAEIRVNKGSKFTDPYVTAIDDVDGDITSKVKTSGTVNTSKTGTYELIYTVSDKAKNKATAKRKVIVVEETTTVPPTTVRTTTRVVTTTKKVTNPPRIILNGSPSVTINVGSTYNDAGYYAVDGNGNNITSRVKVTGSVNTSKAGVYSLTFSVVDSYGNSASAVRRVTVKSTGVQLKSISITPANITMTRGAKETYTVLYNPSNAPHEKVTWSVVSGVGVVTIDSNGVVTANKVGSATIKATTSSGISATTSVTVH